MPLTAVIFEFETVLAETIGARRAALVRSLADDGVSISDEQIAEHCESVDPGEALGALFRANGQLPDAVALDLAVHRAARYFAEAISQGLTLAPGAREFLEAAAGQARLAVVTRMRRQDIEAALALAGLEFAFETIVAAEDVATPKPSGQPYERALNRLARRRSVSPHSTLAIEDSVSGIMAARAVHLSCIAIGPCIPHHAVRADAYVASLQSQTLHTLEQLVARSVRAA